MSGGLAAALRRGVRTIAERHPDDVLPAAGAAAAVRFLIAEGDLIAHPAFLQFVTATERGRAAEIDFPALMAWADRHPSDRDDRIGARPLARLACLLAGHVPPHPAGSDEAELWSLACIFYDLTEENASYSTTGAAIAAFSQLACGVRDAR